MQLAEIWIFGRLAGIIQHRLFAHSIGLRAVRIATKRTEFAAGKTNVG
jgi:hypothetical protein